MPDIDPLVDQLAALLCDGCDPGPCHDSISAAGRVLKFLANAGRLLPDGGETQEEWTMRYKVNGAETLGADVGHVLDDRADAERHIRVWRQQFPSLSYTDVRYLRREVWSGPWVEVTDA